MSKVSGHNTLGEFTPISSRKGFIGTAGTLLLASCGGSALPLVSTAPQQSTAHKDCIEPLIAARNSPATATCGVGNISELTNPEVAALTAAQIGSLTSAQIGQFTNPQLDYITAAKAFYGPVQWSAVLARAVAAQSAAPPLYIPPGDPGPYQPLGYIPPTPGSNLWGTIGGVIGGLIGTAVGSTGGPVVAAFGSVVGGGTLGYFSGLGSDAYFAFYDPNTGYYEAVDLGDGVTGAGPYGFSATGTFDAGTNIVTVTVVEN